MVDIDLIRSKITSLEHNLSRLKEKSVLSWEQFRNDLDTQDIVLHNLQLAIQICVDIGNHIIADENWKVPTTLGDTFQILAANKVILRDMAQTMVSMTGFRNILIHEYEEVDLKKVYHILTNRLSDFADFSCQIFKYLRI